MEQNCPHTTSEFINENIMNILIYKDECTKCFATTKHQDGVDVCLKCYNGSCPSQHFNHSNLHYQFSKHPIVLNIKHIKKQDQQQQPPQKITKLAIGKPGGVDLDTDNYIAIVQLKCLQCKKDLDHQKLQALIDSILLKESAYFQSTVAEWELELKPCEHTLLLNQDQAQKIAEKSMAQCAECDLKSNLWLCMICGHLGCGRKNYDGSGGNNHAVDHGQKQNHPLVCKLGTITPDGTASIFCYSCDDDILDPNLAQHLGVFGIDIKQQVKTERTIQEMNLEANLNLTLSKTIEEGKELIPLYGPNNTGLENLGNSCYMNSVLQVLFSQEEFIKKYLAFSQVHLSECKNFPPECFYCQLGKLVDGMISGRYSQKKEAKKILFEGISEEEKNKVDYCQDGIKPHMFKILIGKNHQLFRTGQQQDAQEYFQFLLEQIMKQEKRMGGSNPGQIFDFDMESRFECCKCKGVQYIVNKANQITMIAPVSSKVEKGTPVDFQLCLNNIFGDELIEGKYCSNCKAVQMFIKRQRLITFPKILLFVLQRFVFDDWVPKKLEIELQVPENSMDFEKYRGTGQPKQNELVLQEEVKQQEPELDQALLNEIMQMGVPENHAKHALYNTGNNDANMAVTWYFDNLNNPDLNKPLLVQKQVQQKQSGIHKDMIENMMAMGGFSEKKVLKALSNCDDNPDRAMDWLFSHMDDPDSDTEMKNVKQDGEEYKDERPGNYQLQSFITHLGVSTHCGHYVAHIKRANDWVYFNDAKVALTKDPPIGKGYMYFFRKQ